MANEGLAKGSTAGENIDPDFLEPTRNLAKSEDVSGVDPTEMDTDASASEQAQNGENVNYTGGGRPLNKPQKAFVKGLKRYGPSGGIAGLIIGFVVLSGGMVGLFPIHMLEMLDSKFDFGGNVSSRRMVKVLKNKLTCKGGGKFCKMSQKTLKRMAKNGIKAYDKNGTAIDPEKIKGKQAISKLQQVDADGKHVGKPITAKGGGKNTSIKSALKSNQSFRTSMNRVYNPKIAWMHDKVANAFHERFGLNRKGLKNSNKGKPVGEQLSEEAKGKSSKKNAKVAKQTQKTDEDGKTVTEDKTIAGVEDDLNQGTAKGGKVPKLKMAGLAALSAVGVTQLGCFIKSAVIQTSALAKTERRQQLMAFATLVAATWEGGIKLGDTDQMNAVHDLANLAMEKTSYDEIDESASAQKITGTEDLEINATKKSTPKSGPESQGVRMLYGDTVSKPDGSANQYTNGGGILSMLAGLLPASVLKILEGATETVCGTVTNPLVMGVTVVAGIGLLVSGGGTVGQAIQGAVVAGLMWTWSSVIRPALIPLLAGTVIAAGISGQNFMNALVSGAGARYSTMAGSFTLGLGEKTAAKAEVERQEYLAMVAADERAERSPFDPTSQYTFVGSMVNKLLPYTASLSSISGIFTTIGSVTSKSIGAILPTAKAADLATFKASMKACDDPIYKNVGVATDMFCNTIMGIPGEFLDMDAETSDVGDSVIDKLLKKGYLTKTGSDDDIDYEEGDTVTNFREYCSEREIPIGLSADEEGHSDAWETGYNCVYQDTDTCNGLNSCIPNEDKALIATYIADKIVDEDMDGDGLDDFGGGKTAPEDSAFSGETCSGVKDCAEKVLDNSNITFSTSGPKTDLNKIIKTGTTDSCGKNVTIDPVLLDALSQLSSKYKVLINNFVAEHSCDSGRHPKGRAVDFNGIEILTGPNKGKKTNWGHITYPADVDVLREYIKDFVKAVNGRSPIGIGQPDCSGVGGNWGVSGKNITQFKGDNCDHLHLDLRG